MRSSLVLVVVSLASSLSCASSPDPAPPPAPPAAPACPTEESHVVERTCAAGRQWGRHECSEAEPCDHGWIYPHQGAEEGCVLPDGTRDGPYVRYTRMGAVVARGLFERGEVIALRDCPLDPPPSPGMERPWPDPKTP